MVRFVPKNSDPASFSLVRKNPGAGITLTQNRRWHIPRSGQRGESTGNSPNFLRASRNFPHVLSWGLHVWATVWGNLHSNPSPIHEVSQMISDRESPRTPQVERRLAKMQSNSPQSPAQEIISYFVRSGVLLLYLFLFTQSSWETPGQGEETKQTENDGRAIPLQLNTGVGKCCTCTPRFAASSGFGSATGALVRRLETQPHARTTWPRAHTTRQLINPTIGTPAEWTHMETCYCCCCRSSRVRVRRPVVFTRPLPLPECGCSSSWLSGSLPPRCTVSDVFESSSVDCS